MEKIELGPGRVMLAAASSFLPPMFLWLTLNYQRPELMQPMLNHIYGYVITLVELLLLIGGAILYVIASQKMSGTRVAIAIASFMLCTLPAMAMILFGPIVFSFMNGPVN